MKQMLFAIGLAFGFVTCASAAAVQVPGYSHVRTAGDIDEYKLDSNGLQVLLSPEHSSPTLTFMVTYRVGSRNEVTGTTGATHLLEHLMFKGTSQRDRRKGNNVDQILEQVGARYNATTWLDRTNYYENLGSQHLATVIDIEADRMRNLLLRESDRKPEMTVVRNEFERGENSPFRALYKEIFQTAFVAHPYHHSTIGHRSDIEQVPIGKLREFYDTFYWPNNATVTIIGDFEPRQALALVKKSFGKYPHSPKPIPVLYTQEPEQSGPRRVTVKRAGQLGMVAIAHKVPAATHADYAALGLLSAILTDGKNSRLYKALTNKNLSTGVNCDLGYNADPSLHMLFLPLAPGATHDQVEQIALHEIERLKQDGVSQAELDAAVAKTLAESAYDRDGSFAIAGKLNESIAAGDWTLYYRLDEAVRKVTLADIQRVANRYLNEDQSTTGWFIPLVAGKSAGADDAIPVGASARGMQYYRDPTTVERGSATSLKSEASSKLGASAPTVGATKIASRILHGKFAEIDLMVYPTGVKDVVSLRATLAAGRAQSGSNPAVATLTAMLLEQGTAKQDKFAIAEQLEAVGATIDFHAGADTLDISARFLKKDTALVIGLLAQQLREPALSEEEFVKAQKQYIGSVKRQLESTDFRAEDAFSRVIYPQGHPNRNPEPQALIAAIEATKLDDVKAFHSTHYGPAHMTMVVTGDVPVTVLQDQVSQAFSGWSQGNAAVRAIKAIDMATATEATIDMPGKTSVSVVLGQASGLTYNHPDYLALRVGTAILGSGFTGRLMANVRDKEGLTYGIDAGLDNDSFNEGQWNISATFAPTLLAQGIASTRRQLALWYTDGVTEAEVQSRKTNLIGAFQVSLATSDGIANSLLATVKRGLPPSWIDDYPARIHALTTAQINAAIKKYLHPERMVLIKAGSPLSGKF